MSATLYIFRLVWPFLKELLLGGLTLREGMRHQRKKVFLLFFVSALIIALFMIIPKFYILSQEHIKLEKSVTAANVKRLEDKITELEAKTRAAPVIVPIDPDIPPPKVVPPPVVLPELKKPIRSPKSPKPIEPVSKPPGDDLSNRKKSYMDFFEKYND